MLRGFATLMAALAVVAAGAGSSIAVADAPGYVCQPDKSCVHVTWHGSVSGHEDFPGTELATPALQTQAETYYPQCFSTIDGTRCAPPDQSAAGTPITDLIADLHAGFVTDAVSTVTVSTPTGPAAGRVATLAAADLVRTPDPFLPCAGETPTPYIFVRGTLSDQITYLRPQRVDGDPNLDDEIDTLSNGELDIDMDVQGAVLYPTIHAVAQPGNEVAFSTTLRVPASGVPSYEWHFGDGTSERTSPPTVVHAYPGSGNSYSAYVIVTDTNGSRGQSPAVTVAVGKPVTPRPSTHSTPGRGTASSGHPLVGPRTGVGLHAGERPTTPSSAIPYGPSSGASSNAGRGGTGSTPARASAATRAAAGSDEQGFVPVDGILLDPDATVETQAAQRQSGQPETAPAARRGATAAGTAVLGIGLGALAVLLLALGALGESRRPARTAGRRSRT